MNVYAVSISLPNDDGVVSIKVRKSLDGAKKFCLDDGLSSCHIEEGDEKYVEYVGQYQDDNWTEDEVLGERCWVLDVDDGQVQYTIFETDLME